MTRISIRRRLSTGQSFDLVTGCDLTSLEEQKILLKYIRLHEPEVIVAGPPCTAFANLSRINRWKYPETYAKCRAIGLKLANFLVQIVEIQLAAGRFILIENPAGSELFDLPGFIRLWKTGKFGRIIFPQCATGLLNPEGTLPIRKLTELWSNAPELFEPFEGLVCTHTQHAPMVGTYDGRPRSKCAQVWPTEFCRKIVEGICTILREKMKRQAGDLIG